MPHLTKPRRRRPLFEPVEPRLLFTTLPATTTSLTLSTPVTAANQPLTLTATVTSNPGSPSPTGTVAFFETIDFSHGPLQVHDPFHPSTYVTLTGNSESAQLLGTATVAGQPSLDFWTPTLDELAARTGSRTHLGRLLKIAFT